MVPKLIYINGSYVLPAEAKVSVFDRGFLFGDSVYEVIPVYQKKPFFWQKHLDRLKFSLEQTKIPYPELDWLAIFNKLIAENDDGKDVQLYLQISRGAQETRKHDIPPNPSPTVIVFTLQVAYPTF